MTDQAITQQPDAWSGVAEKYERVFAPISRQFARHAMRLAGVEADTQVLDVAAGTGSVSLSAAALGARVLATDFSREMLGRLEARLAREGTEGVRTALMDGQQLDLADASFDVTCSAFGLMFFPDRARGLREMRRVLRPGGRAAIVVWNRVDQLAPHVHFVKALMAAVPGYALPENPPSWLEIQNPERLAQELEQAGFADVAVHTVTENWHVSSAQLLWENLHGISPAMTEITDGLSSEVLEKAGRAFIESFTEEFGAGETDMPVEGLVGLGIKATQNGAGPEEA